MKDILISGANGFVGGNLGKHLGGNGYSISKLSRKADGQNNTFTWDDIGALKYHDFEAFIHLAGKAHDLKNTSEPAEYFEVNTGLKKQLFDVFLQSNVTAFIYISSVTDAADTVADILYEDVVPDPKTVYGQSKQMAEEYLLSKELPCGKKLYILRPCMIHGPGNKGNLNLLYKFVMKRVPYPFAAFINRRSFLSIDNLKYIIERIVKDKTISGGIYNIADDEPLSTNEVVKTISEASGLKARLWKLSPQLIRAIASAGDKIHLPLNSERLKKLTESYVVSNDKIKKALKIDTLPVSAIEGLKLTINSFSADNPA